MPDKFAENVAMSPARRLELERKLAEEAIGNDLTEAAEHAERIVAILNAEWTERSFSPEQAVFALALACCNFRDHFPEKDGGPPFFDRVARAARAYFEQNRGG